MSGTQRGSVNHYIRGINTITPGMQSQFAFKAIYDYFCAMTASASASLIALQTGSSGTGTDYYFDANPFGENAFAVFRMERPTSGKLPYYVLMQWANVQNFGTAPGDPANVGGSTTVNGVGIAVAYDTGGVNPWAGTTLANGNDRKAATVWSGSQPPLHLWPRSNSLGGSYATNRQALCAAFTDPGDIGTYLHIVGDEDSFAIVTNVAQGNDHIFFFGEYEKHTASEETNPLFGFYTNSPPYTEGSTIFGTTSGNPALDGGLIHPIQVVSGTIGFALSTLAAMRSAFTCPNTALTGNPLVQEFKLAIWGAESNNYGLAGFTTFVKGVFKINSRILNSAKTRLTVGSSDIADNKFSIPWVGGINLCSGTSHRGYQFYG